MTDNGSAYVSRLFTRTLCRLTIRHIRTRPCTPKTNGKAERFIQTALNEWAYAAEYRSSAQRRQRLPEWPKEHNWLRPHGSLNDQPPVSVIG